MSEYKPKFIDPNNVSRMKSQIATTSREYDKVICQSYLLRKLNLYTKEDFDEWQKNLQQQFKDRESSWWTKLWGQVWYRLVLPKATELTSPKQLFKVLSKIDKLIPYLPPGYWIYVLKGIDWVADLVYKNISDK